MDITLTLTCNYCGRVHNTDGIIYCGQSYVTGDYKVLCPDCNCVRSHCINVLQCIGFRLIKETPENKSAQAPVQETLAKISEDKPNQIPPENKSEPVLQNDTSDIIEKYFAIKQKQREIQSRYFRTPKGKAAQQRAIKNYQKKHPKSS